MIELALSHAWPASLIDAVLEHHREPHRHYHTLEHVDACLRAARALSSAPSREVELALLFHDAVYDPKAKDNEQRSAELLLTEGRRAWVQEELLQRAAPLILATKHLDDDVPEEACWVVDADLSILGADEAMFDHYEDNVRKEYAFVDDAAFAAGRRKFVREMLEREHIFVTRKGRTLWEESARRNLRRSEERWRPEP